MLPHPNRITRSTSLSHARSPSALASSSYGPLPGLDTDTESFELRTHRSLKGLHPQADGIPLAKIGESTVFEPDNETFNNLSDVDDEEDLAGETISEDRIIGVFQPPISSELLGIIISFSLVTLLAIAAGATTIYDWVL